MGDRTQNKNLRLCQSEHSAHRASRLQPNFLPAITSCRAVRRSEVKLRATYALINITSAHSTSALSYDA